MTAVSQLPHIFYKPHLIPQPPSPPDFTSSAAAFAGVANGSAQPATQTSSDTTDIKSADKPESQKPTSSIGMSPVVQAFLLRLQELGLSSIPGTDGSDR